MENEILAELKTISQLLEVLIVQNLPTSATVEHARLILQCAGLCEKRIDALLLGLGKS